MQRFKHILPRSDRLRMPDPRRFSRPDGVEDIRHQAILRKVAAPNDISGPGSRQHGGAGPREIGVPVAGGRQLRAPFAGVVVTKNAQPGEMISPISAGGGFTRTGICTIVDMTSLEIEVDVNEAYIQRVKAGQDVNAVLDAYPDWQIPAEVIAIVPTADRQKATVRVRIGFRERDSRVLRDMGVKVAFLGSEQAATETAPPVIYIPSDAIKTDSEGSYVWIIRDNSVQRRAVTVGPGSGAGQLIRTGLSVGDRIVISAEETLRPGQAVSISN